MQTHLRSNVETITTTFVCVAACAASHAVVAVVENAVAAAANYMIVDHDNDYHDDDHVATALNIFHYS